MDCRPVERTDLCVWSSRQRVFAKYNSICQQRQAVRAIAFQHRNGSRWVVWLFGQMMRAVWLYKGKSVPMADLTSRWPTLTSLPRSQTLLIPTCRIFTPADICSSAALTLPIALRSFLTLRPIWLAPFHCLQRSLTQFFLLHNPLDNFAPFPRVIMSRFRWWPWYDCGYCPV